MPSISIIVPVYNTSQFLAQCLDSLVNQTYQDIEIVCINDGSTDDSLDVLRRYEQSYDTVRVINRGNGGVSSARNAGLEAATGDYLMFVDSDDWVDTDYCARMMEVALTHDADCVMCSYAKEFGKKSVEEHVFPESFQKQGNDVQDDLRLRLFGPIGTDLQSPHHVDLITAVWMQLFKAEMCEGVRFTDLSVIGTSEDLLYQVEVYKNCNSFAYIDEPMYHYRKTNTGSITTQYKAELFERWQNLYAMMEDIVTRESLGDVYSKALDNRIACQLIGLGLNEVGASVSLLQKSKRLKHIISHPRYIRALSQLDTSCMPAHWKMFFSLLKKKKVALIVYLLEVMQLIRNK